MGLQAWLLQDVLGEPGIFSGGGFRTCFARCLRGVSLPLLGVMLSRT